MDRSRRITNLPLTTVTVVNLSLLFVMSVSVKAVKSCYIRGLDETPTNVYLPDNTPIFVGRSPETGITDTKCSRQQVRLCANYVEAIVTVQQIGPHACGFNGFKTKKGVRFIARHNDRLELLYGKHTFEIEFNPPPSLANFSLKKNLSEPEAEETENRAKILKLDSCPEESENDKEEEKRLSLNGVHSNLKGLSKDSSTSSEQNNETSSTSAKWDSVDNGKLLIYTASSVSNRAKVAAYDMDGTLIKTKSGLVFPKDCNDWQLLYPEVPGKLKQLHVNEYKIVIFTNQAGLSKPGKVKIVDFKSKIEKIVQKIGVPIQVFIAVGKNIYRKPTIGMWELLEKEKNGGIAIDKANSFYIGDAAGRPKNWGPGKKKDHSNVDRLMALNLDIKFQTPEEHFLKYKTPPYDLPTFNPKSLPQTDVCKPADTELNLKQQEMILMVGSPGSGKSHFAKHYLMKYEYVNRDTLRSWQKCVVAVQQYLNQGKSVVIDNTNPDPASRQRYIEIAKKHSVPIRCFVMTTSIEHVKHNNKFRELTDPSHIPINEIIINSYVKNYIPPTLEEGLKEIVEINFVPNFRNEQDRRLYEMYLLES